MNNEVSIHHVLIRFKEPDNSGRATVTRLCDFTNYDGLVVAVNCIDAIDVDIRSYGFDHKRVKNALFKFVNDIKRELFAECFWNPGDIVVSSRESVGPQAEDPIREVSYIIGILK